jgi:NADH-quinone oxidoreductase subunit J
MHVSTGASIAFWMLAVVAVGSALGVILLRDMFRAVLFLVVTFLAVAGLFVTLNADFVAAVQVLIYAGAISILLIFAVLLTRDVQQGNPSNRWQLPGMFLGGVLVATLIVAVVNTDWRLSAEEPLQSTTASIADTLFTDAYVLPLEIASALLVSAMIGAVVLARGRDE